MALVHVCTRVSERAHPHLAPFHQCDAFSHFPYFFASFVPINTKIDKFRKLCFTSYNNTFISSAKAKITFIKKGISFCGRQYQFYQGEMKNSR